VTEHATIEHPGIVSNVDAETIYVNIEVSSACSSCHAKGYCSAFGSSEKVIEVPSKQFSHVVVGDKVIVSISESLGLKALLIGYIIPAFILLLALFIALIFTDNEAVAALITLLVVAVYYIALWLNRGLLKKQISFGLKVTE